MYIKPPGAHRSPGGIPPSIAQNYPSLSLFLSVSLYSLSLVGFSASLKASVFNSSQVYPIASGCQEHLCPFAAPTSRCSSTIFSLFSLVFILALPRISEGSSLWFPLSSITPSHQEYPLSASASSLWCRSIPFPISNFPSLTLTHNRRIKFEAINISQTPQVKMTHLQHTCTAQPPDNASRRCNGVIGPICQCGTMKFAPTNVTSAPKYTA